MPESVMTTEIGTAALETADEEVRKEDIREMLMRMEADFKKKLKIAEEALNRTIRREEKLSIDNGVIDYSNTARCLSKNVSTLRKCLRQINQALEDLANGIYGICKDEGCGDLISSERLLVEPFAQYCIGCKRKIEEKESRERRRNQYGGYHTSLAYCPNRIS